MNLLSPLMLNCFALVFTLHLVSLAEPDMSMSAELSGPLSSEIGQLTFLTELDLCE